MTATTAFAAYFLWQGGTPDATRSLKVCERMHFMEFDQETDRWVALSSPVRTMVVCPVPGTTGELNIKGLQQPFVDKPHPAKMIEVDCFKSARIKSGAPATQMPDGLFCNIPVVVN